MLNQYTQRTVPGALWVQGDAAVSAGVQVNGVTAGRHGSFYSRDLPADNITGAVYAAVAITGTGTNGATVVTNTVNGHLFAPQTPEALTYDYDGNLTSDGRWTYTWDAENRLITQTSVGTAVPAVRLAFTYDANSRRVRKQVYNWAPATANWLLVTDHFFTYDGWNLIREERRPDAYYRSINMDYAWGLDLSGSMQGAGGIGGLLGIMEQLPSAFSLQPSVCFTTYDANGNLNNLIDSTSGTIFAHYEYDPFGNTLAATGPAAKDNPFRFSTKYTDDETGLIYYGYRYMSPLLGRFVNRDPMQERGGRNLFAFVLNNPTGNYDPDGRVAGATIGVVLAAVDLTLRHVPDMASSGSGCASGCGLALAAGVAALQFANVNDVRDSALLFVANPVAGAASLAASEVVYAYAVHRLTEDASACVAACKKKFPDGNQTCPSTSRFGPPPEQPFFD